MKLIFSGLFLFISSFGFNQSYNSDSLKSERNKHQSEFVNDVLNKEEALHFQGICYFEIDTTLFINATFKKDKGKKFVMQMTKERVVYYRKYGTLTFKINDTICSLTVYQNLDLIKRKGFENYLFLPFKDLTSEVTTYGGGRYLDIEIQKGSQWKIDFNLAYHPYCAYSERYSCPIVPKENKLNVYINAGECYNGH